MQLVSRVLQAAAGALLSVCCCGFSLADELRVLSAGAIEPGLKAAAAAFEKQTGQVAQITFNTAPELKKAHG